MKPRRIDLAGQRFGRLTVLEYVGLNDQYVARWRCRCDCGTVCVINSTDLRKGKTRSCGCLRSEVATAHLDAAHLGCRLPLVVLAPDGIRHYFASQTEVAEWLGCSQATVHRYRVSGKRYNGHTISTHNQK